MSVNKRAFTINGLFLWLALCSVYSISDASLKTLFVEELCYGTFETTLNLRFQNSAILSSVPSRPLDCEITLEPLRDYSIVIAFSRYSLSPGDSLVFKDRHNFQLSLTGGGNFLDERKSMTFEGPLRIHFITNDTDGPHRLKFQLVYTQVHDGPCEVNEYKCRNNKCIPSNLACDKHNHCGDIDNQADCKPKNLVKVQRNIFSYVIEQWLNNDAKGPKNEITYQEDRIIITTYRNPWIITIVVCAAVLFIVVVSFAAVGIKRQVQKKKNKKVNQSQQLPPFAGSPPVQHLTPPTVVSASGVQGVAPPTVAATNDVQHVAPPSVVERIRHTFKREHKSDSSQQAAPPALHAPQNYQVPSMYPILPSAPEYDGVDNPEFQADE